MYTKDINTPPEFRLLPYDHNSLMHFGFRDFSINGHRTFIFLNRELEQNRIGLTPIDIRKFEIVYGPQCLQRDRQDQVELCRFYPDSGTVPHRRRKRETEPKDDKTSADDDLHLATKNLRVNPNITPPQDVVEVTRSLKTLGIEKEVQSIVESVFNVTQTALRNARATYCKVDEKANVRTQDENDKSTDILGFYHLVTDYAQGMVDTATANITQFCEESESMSKYLRIGCDWQATDPRCTGRFKPTKSGSVRYSTQHRPIIPQSTKHWPLKRDSKYVPILRGENGNNFQPDGDEQENVESLNGEVTEGENEKKALRMGGTGLPIIKKSLRRHRQSENTDTDVWSIIKDEHKKDRARTKPIRPHRQPDIYSKRETDYENEAKKDKENTQYVATDSESSEERNIKPKNGVKHIDSDIEGDLHKELEDTNDKSNYENESEQTKSKSKKNEPKIRDYDTEPDEDSKAKERNSQEYAAEIVPKEKLKSNKYAETVSVTPQADIRNLNNRFQVQNQREEEERNKKRKKLDSEEEEVKTESEERKGKKKLQSEMEEDESRETVQKESKERVRQELKDMTQKEPKEKVRREPRKIARKEPKEMPQKESMEMVHKEPKEMIRKEPKEMVREESIEMVQKKSLEKLRKKPKEMIREESEEIVRKESIEMIREVPKEKLAKVEKKQKNYSVDESVKKHKKRQKNKKRNGHLAGNREQETKTKDKRSDNGPLPATVPLTKENKEFYKDRKWRGGVIPYVIKPIDGYDMEDIRRRIEEVNAILKERTCTRLNEISENEAGKASDYLYIDDSPDYVTGRVGGKQIFGSVELLEGGQHRQHTAMMVMAMLGFYFEVSRHDRDKYIRVHMRHVRPDKLHHFEKIRSDATLAVPYDYQSATHPSWQFWRQYGRSGISTVATYKETDPDGTLMKSLGQNTKLLSETDIVKINSIYGVRCFLRSSASHKNRGRKEVWQRDRAY